MRNKLLPASFFNPISILGGIVALIAWIAFLFLVILTKSLGEYNVYMEIFTYLIVPVFLIVGLLLIAIGMMIRKRLQRKGIEGLDKKNIFIFNLNEVKTRNSLIIFISVTVIFIISTVVGSYEAFHYTESNEFCGKLCHKVMTPEYSTYQLSPHARVPCVECHIGEGVNWFVKSKISGVRQVFHYISSTFPMPIETPLISLRPAKETCEKCHWPQKFYTHKLNHFKYFLRDSANTEWDLVLKMKIGPSHQSFKTSEGIHWHINPDVEIQYKASEQRDSVFWVKYSNKKTGTETIFQDEEMIKSDSELAVMQTRTMDCMDCHNRPSHEYRSPYFYINNLFVSGKIPSSVPWLKRVGMIALKPKYSTVDSAVLGIKNKILTTYQNKYPEVLRKHKEEIDSAAAVITLAYLENTFPEMKISFREYPRHIGHFESDGCFRCHNGRYKSDKGKEISKDCYNCHTIVQQGIKDSTDFCDINSTLDYIHPVDIENDWQEQLCSDCHSLPSKN
ncbi:MAG: NapC/NirT family cytochrome c [Bacteroidetes bacterium]|nr:NapC/NirT family cytochrome c [Bacteroidota bacterium]